MADLTIGTGGGGNTETDGCVDGETIVAKASNGSGPLRWVEWNCTISFRDVPGGNLRAGWQTRKKEGCDRECTPSSGKIIGVDERINGWVWEFKGRFVWEGVILEDAELVRFSWLGDNREW